MNNITPYQFDLGALFNKVWKTGMPEYDLKSTNESDAFASKFGSSVYRKADAVGRYYFMPVKLGDVELQYPIIRIQGRKNIVETQLTERKGSVIEIINQESYQIYIRGFLINHTGDFPEEAVHEMKELFETNQSVPIRSVLTDLFLTDEDSVVIADLSFPEVTGVENVKPYELNLISDSNFELEIE